MFAWQQTLQMCPGQTVTSLPPTLGQHVHVLTNYIEKPRLETSSANLEIDTSSRPCSHVINNLLKTSLRAHCCCKVFWSLASPRITSHRKQQIIFQLLGPLELIGTRWQRCCYLLQIWERRRIAANFMLSSFDNCNVAKIFQRTSGRAGNTKF